MNKLLLAVIVCVAVLTAAAIIAEGMESAACKTALLERGYLPGSPTVQQC